MCAQSYRTAQAQDELEYHPTWCSLRFHRDSVRLICCILLRYSTWMHYKFIEVQYCVLYIHHLCKFLNLEMFYHTESKLCNSCITRFYPYLDSLVLKCAHSCLQPKGNLKKILLVLCTPCKMYCISLKLYRMTINIDIL